MKRSFTLSFFIATSIIISSAINPSNKTLTGNWTLICYSDFQTGQQDCRAQSIQKYPISFEFKDNGLSGTFSGHTSSNRVSGDYKIHNTKKIIVENFGGTKLGERTSWGNAFWDAISSSSSFDLSSDTLMIYYDNDTKVMTFAQTILK